MFELVNISENIINKIDLPHGQVKISNLKAVPNKKRAMSLKNSFSHLEFSNIIDLDSQTRLERQKSANETFRFLIRNSDYHLNKKELSRLKYLEAVSSINRPVMQLFYRIFGGLFYPWRILLYIGCIVVIFALLYSIPFFTFNTYGSNGDIVQRGLKFWEGLYFSGISFTTIGYGDISPINYSKVLTVIEGFLGVILSSSFLVSLVRRYID